MLTSQLITLVAFVTLWSRTSADGATRLGGDDTSEDFGDVLTSYKQIQSISEGSDCRCRCIVRPQVVGPCPGRPGLDRVEFSIDTISGGSDCRCRCMTPTPQHTCQSKDVNRGKNDFDQEPTAPINNQRSPLNVVDLQNLLDRAITGVDVRKIHSGVTKMVLAMIDLEQALKVNIAEHGTTMRQNMNKVVSKMENTSNYSDSLDIINHQMHEHSQVNATTSPQETQTTVPTVASSSPTTANFKLEEIISTNQSSTTSVFKEVKNTSTSQNSTLESNGVQQSDRNFRISSNEEESLRNESDLNAGHKMASKPTYLNVTSPSVTSSPLQETNNVMSSVPTAATSPVTSHDVINTSHDVTRIKSSAAPPRVGKFVPYKDDFDIGHQGGAKELAFHYDDNNEVVVHPPLVGASDEFDIAKQSSTAEEQSSTTQSYVNVSSTTEREATTSGRTTLTTRTPIESNIKPTQSTLTTHSVTRAQSSVYNTTVGSSTLPTTTQQSGETTTDVTSQPITMEIATSQIERSTTSSDLRTTEPFVGESLTSASGNFTTVGQSSTTRGQSSTTRGQSSTTKVESSTTRGQSLRLNEGQSGAGNSHTDYYSPVDDVGDDADDDDFYDDYLDESTTTSTTTEATTTLESAPCGTLFNLSKPQVIHDFGRREGSWMRDPLARGRRRGKIYVTNFYYGNTLIEFDNMRAFKHFRMSHSHMLPYSWIGTGHIVYNGSFYYNRAFSKNIIKYNLKKRFVSAWGHLRNAVYDPTTPFTWRGHTMVHMAADESGLWVIYAAHSDTGAYPNAQVYVVNKINPVDLQTIQSWKTPIRRRGASHLFLVCGIVYVTDRFESRRARITHAYDTHTGVGRYLFVPFLQSYAYNVQMLYNPREKRVYSWDKGHQVIYDVNFSY